MTASPSGRWIALSLLVGGCGGQEAVPDAGGEKAPTPAAAPKERPIGVGDTALLGPGTVLTFGDRPVAVVAKGTLTADVTGIGTDALTVRPRGRTRCTPADLGWAGIDFAVARNAPLEVVRGRLTHDQTCEHVDPPKPEPPPPGYTGRPGGPMPGHMVERRTALSWAGSGERAGVLLTQHLFTAAPREDGDALCFDPSDEHVRFEAELCVPKSSATEIKVEGTIGLGNYGRSE